MPPWYQTNWAYLTYTLLIFGIIYLIYRSQKQLFLEQQQKYEEIRTRAVALWHELKEKALEEDKKGTGQYPESERLLAELDKYNQSAAVPRIIPA